MSDALPSRDELLSIVANAALFGSLGLFVGTGLSRDLTGGEARSFKDLLVSVCRRLSIDFDFNNIESVSGKSYPQVAEEMAQILARERGCSHSEATLHLKREICRICDLRPDSRRAEAFRDVLRDMPVQWAITTNYDFILEDLIPGATPLLPDQLLNARADQVPVYHLHGHVQSPESIVVTDLDYVRLLAPTEYRQLKLNLLTAESTTLMMGYSLGDINVKNALEWSRAFKDEWGLRVEPHQSTVVQALYKSGPTNPDPQLGLSGEVIVEVRDLLMFLQEIAQAIAKRRSDHESCKALLGNWLDASLAEKVADDPAARQEFLQLLARLPRSYDLPTVIRFLGSVFDPIWEMARIDGGWVHYDRFLNVLIDALENIPAKDIHPSLLSYLAEQLDELSSFIDPDGVKQRGTSFAASRTWQERKGRIPLEMRNALAEFARSRSRFSLLALLGEGID